MTMKKMLVLACCFLLFAAPASARSLGGVELPETLDADGVTLNINGADVRKKFKFVSVYAGGLYLAQKASDATAIINADEPMAIAMAWIRGNTPKADVAEAWKEGFGRATGGNLASINDGFERFLAFFPEKYEKNDLFVFAYTPERGTALIYNGVEKDVIEGMEFKKALFGNWLGENPGDSSLENLKRKMLGN
ncbi:MAG: chalcone isomerase family protein [Desulfatibacillaceae bacterium]|nr:chalcone isomerase family protein [Desulfatibacillaceae bacterium]